MRPLAAALLVAATAPAAVAARPPAAPADGPNVGPGYALGAPVELAVVVPEAAPPERLLELGRLPGVEVVVRLEGNMVADAALPVLRRLPRATVRLRAPLLPVHVEQLARVPALGVWLDASAAPLDRRTLALLGRLGPRRLTVELDGRAGFAALPALPAHASVVARFGDRLPGPEELHALASARGPAAAAFGVAAPPEALRSAAGQGLALVLATSDERLPPRQLAELSRLPARTSVELGPEASASDVERLRRVPQLGRLVFRLDGPRGIPDGVAARLAALRPAPPR